MAEDLVRIARLLDDRQKAERLFQSASDARRRYDWEWLTRDLFRRGYQFSRYDPNNRTIILSTRSMVKIPINITNAQMRTIKNQITSIRPKWEVLPRSLSEESRDNARYSGRTLDYYYDHLNLRRLLKETIIQGLMYSVGGPWQIGYDPMGGENGEGSVFVWLLDPFDFYIDPAASSLKDAQFVIKAVRTSLNKIKANPEYSFFEDLANIRGEFRLAASEYKQFLLQALKYYQPKTTLEEEEGVILKEAWIPVYVTEDNTDVITEELKLADQDFKNLRMGEMVMKVITYIDSLEMPLKYRYQRQDYYPFTLYQADVNPMEIYGESWIKHVIPMNRVLNALESSIFKYNYKYAIGRIVVDKNSGVRIITNEHGDIVEKNAGAEVFSLPLQPLPSSYQVQIGNMRQYMEDVGGAHEVSMGRIPAGVKSGIGIAELKAADAVNQQDLVDALEEFLGDVGYKVLRVIAEYYDIPKVIKVLGKTGAPEHFTVIGEKGATSRKNRKEVRIGPDTFNLSVIGKDNEVQVTVGTWLAYTKGARIDRLKEFYQSGLIDQQTFLEHAEFADIEDIVDKTRKEELLKKFRGTPAAGAEGTEVSDEEIAQQENLMMTVEKRNDVEPLPEDNHQIHLMVHRDAIGFSGDPIIEEHMRKHEEMAKQGSTLPARPGAVNPDLSVMQPPLEGVAPGVQGTAPVTQPIASPEEAALQQSLQAVMGG